jgi:hypothetical protein
MATRAPARPAARRIGTIEVVIEGIDLPGRECGPDREGAWCRNVQVGLARGQETVGLVSGDAARADWTFPVDLAVDEQGGLDFHGPFVLGPRDQRHLGLRWLRDLPGGGRGVFRGAKFRLWELDRSLFERSLQSGRRLVGRVGLTDEFGWPRCATVRPPIVEWRIERD